MTHLISINGHAIRQNVGKLSRGESLEAPIRIARKKSAGAVGYANDVEIMDAGGNVVARLVYTPEAPQLKCGARLVLQTEHDVRVVS